MLKTVFKNWSCPDLLARALENSNACETNSKASSANSKQCSGNSMTCKTDSKSCAMNSNAYETNSSLYKTKLHESGRSFKGNPAFCKKFYGTLVLHTIASLISSEFAGK